ncbi:MAG: hypothetical protein KAS53_03655, partial [Candidatus Cloacimonetes bacterium]|nr:hypothetical protein [Candidatus Cloacimonadota bacterium]
ELKPQDLLNSNNFNKKLLSCSNFDLLMEKDQFWNFKNLIRSLDNNKYIIPIPGYGKINDFIINLGNKVFINGKLTKFEETIWVDRTGYKIDKTELISISDQKTSLSKIWDSFHQLYGMQAVLIIGFATATLFFQQYMEQKKHFPLLYVLAGSGRGKNGLTDLICSLSGLNESIVNINCAGNSTKIGVEGKSLLLNNLPLVLNELTEGHFDFIKSRYDGQGSVKFNEKSSNQIAERTVNGSTMITTVVRPLDKQIISRCIFVDLDITKLNKELFDKVKEESADFSSFIIKIIQSIAFPDILDSVMEFRKGINPSKALPRVIDNYSLIGGCFNIFRKMVNNSGDLPTADEVTSFIEEQITITENYLNPLIYFIRELESLLDQPKTTNMFAQDNIHLYFNFQSVWKQISDSYKKKYFPFMNDGNIKRLLLESDYMTVYGADITHNDKKMFGKPVYKYPKKIGAQTKRCYVLLKDKLPGYYR